MVYSRRRQALRRHTTSMLPTPISRIRRATVHRATTDPSGVICRQTFSTPYSLKVSSHTRDSVCADPGPLVEHRIIGVLWR